MGYAAAETLAGADDAIRSTEPARVHSATVGWPLTARAKQSERVRRVAVLEGIDDVEGRARRSALQAELERLGWTDGVNIRLDYRWAQGDTERIRALKRRDFISLVGGAVAWPTVARGQQQRRTAHIGIFSYSRENFDPQAMFYIDAFLKGLAEFGWSQEFG
jgi:hypothetical protein